MCLTRVCILFLSTLTVLHRWVSGSSGSSIVPNAIHLRSGVVANVIVENMTCKHKQSRHLLYITHSTRNTCAKIFCIGFRELMFVCEIACMITLCVNVDYCEILAYYFAKRVIIINPIHGRCDLLFLGFYENCTQR